MGRRQNKPKSHKIRKKKFEKYHVPDTSRMRTFGKYIALYYINENNL